MLAVALVVLVGQALADYARGLTPVVLVESGRARQVRTLCGTVGEVLDDLDVVVGPWDRVSPARDAALEPHMRIEVSRAASVELAVDGSIWTVHTHQRTVDEILDEAGVELRPGDEVHAEGLGQNTSDQVGGGPLRVRAAFFGGARGWERVRAPAVPSRIDVLRAAHINLLDGEASHAFYSTAGSVSQALSEAQVPLYEGDLIEPGLDTPLTDGLRVQIRRAKPVEVLVDGRALRTRTQHTAVGDVLAEMGVALLGQDFCDPPLDAPVMPGAQLSVTRVSEHTEIEQDELPFETEWVADSALELDRRYLEDQGAIGVRRRRFKVIYHDGVPVDRVLEEDWLAQAPRPRRIAYGTKIVVRTLDTPHGQIEYWRRIQVFRTAYTAATCGKTPDHPLYGITRLGWPMRHGIIATDPRVIPLRSSLYVPGYGPAIAGDTGGLIKGRHIDLGYEVGSMMWHFEWGYVYLLTPVPSASQINYILPDFPQVVY
jgi:uncharacterized protein YabE (DUF348 family)